MSRAICIAIVGAECTGKTTLAQTLAARLALGAGRVAWVPERLRQWCDEQGRTPRADEQAAIAVAQHQRIRAAALAHDIVVCDTTALMTAVYSRIVFGDHLLEAMAVALHRETSLTLLTALDLPWVGDGLQRDGPHVRVPVDDALRELMHAHGIGHAVVAGRGEQRVAQAQAAVARRVGPPGLATPAKLETHTGVAANRSGARTGLFTGLDGDEPAAGQRGVARGWACDCCVPDAERALARRRRDPVV